MEGSVKSTVYLSLEFHDVTLIPVDNSADTTHTKRCLSWVCIAKSFTRIGDTMELSISIDYRGLSTQLCH